MDQTSVTEQSAAKPRSRRRGRLAAILLAVFTLAVVALILLWNWDWFVPIVQSQASAAIGRRVTIKHLHVRLGRQTTVAADDVVVANPDGFPASDPLATVNRLDGGGQRLGLYTTAGASCCPTSRWTGPTSMPSA